MCIKLKQTGEIITPGKTAIILTNRGLKPMKWGFDTGLGDQANARVESLKEKWLNKGYEFGHMEVDSFFERDERKRETEFKFCKPNLIGIVYKSDHFLVVTEQASPQVAKVHHRQPCIRQLPLLKAS